MADAVDIEINKENSFWDFRAVLPFVDDWFLMRSPYPIIFILVTYLFFVLHCGRKFMENRPAYELRNVLLVYNAFQVVYSLYMFCLGVEGIYEFGLFEQGCFILNAKNAHRLLSGHHLYFIAKLTELLDTVFFVLRKKWNQVSFLHVYHHSLMFSFSWIIMKFDPTYSLLFTGVLNSFVHIVMYTYYGLSAFPHLREYLWWKKYITKLQLLQFGLITLHVTWSWKHTTCPPSYILMTLCWGHLLLFIYLFTDFYYKSYQSKNNSANVEEDASKKVQ
ncbi:GNS1/SUR4 family domain-containing protein [Phthorimaea operculella]|nr:GNS1/SUR4 family domain-containing protein [Phthorimaea operculella]